MEESCVSASATTTLLSPSGGDNERIRQESMGDKIERLRYVPPGSVDSEHYRLATLAFCPCSWDQLKAKNAGRMAEEGFRYAGYATECSCFSCGFTVDMATNRPVAVCHNHGCSMKNGENIENRPSETSLRKAVCKHEAPISLSPVTSDRNMQKNDPVIFGSSQDIGFGDFAAAAPRLSTAEPPKDTYIRHRQMLRIRLPSHAEETESGACDNLEELKSPVLFNFPQNYRARRRLSSSSVDGDEPPSKASSNFRQS